MKSMQICYSVLWFLFFFSAGIPCTAAVGIQCPSDFNHETKTVFNTTSVYYGFLGVFKTGKVSFILYLSQYLESCTLRVFVLKQISLCVIAESEGTR